MNLCEFPDAVPPLREMDPFRMDLEARLFGRARPVRMERGPVAKERMARFSDALLWLYAPCAADEFPRRAMEVARQILPARVAVFEQRDPGSEEIRCEILGPKESGDELPQGWRRHARAHPIWQEHWRRSRDRVELYGLEDVRPAPAREGGTGEQAFFESVRIPEQVAVFFPMMDLVSGVFLGREEPFEPEERRLLRWLGPHLAQAHTNHLLLAPPEARPAACRNLAWQRLRSAGFSRRECEVLEWLAEGKGDDDIAQILGLSRKTVSNQVWGLTHKLGACNRIGAVTAALQMVEMPHPVELEETGRDRDEQFQAHLLKWAAAPTPAALLQHLRQMLAEWWPGRGAEAWLVPLDDPANRFAPLAPARVAAYAERLAVHGAGGEEGALPALGAPQGTVGAVRYLPISATAYVWENRAAPAGELLTALVMVPERLALAIVVREDARAFGSQRLAEWHRLVPHLLVAARRTHRLVQAMAGPTSPAPGTDSPRWHWLAECGLTDRQVETLAWVAAGLADQEIADQLAVSVRTVHAHLRAIFETLGVENRLAAVVEACRYLARREAFEGD